jgi:O-antigen/teichoic acid export membrane protein
LAYLGWLTPSTSLIVLALSFCVGLIMLVWFVGRHINLSLKMDWRLLGGTVFYGLKLGVATMMTGLAAQLTLMLLRYLRAGDFGEVGLYGRAVAISGFALLVPHALAPLLYSKFSATEGESRTRQVEMACRMNCAYGAVSALLIVFLGKYALRIMYGEEFVPAGQALIFLGPAVFLVPITGVMINLLSGDGRAILNVVLTGVPMVVAVLVSLVAVPTLGFRGSAIAVLCGNACGALTALGVCRKLYGVNPLRCWVVTSRDLKYVRKSLRG